MKLKVKNDDCYQPVLLNRGIEISSEIADISHSLILDQVKYGVAMSMAALYLTKVGASGGD